MKSFDYPQNTNMLMINKHIATGWAVGTVCACIIPLLKSWPYVSKTGSKDPIILWLTSDVTQPSFSHIALFFIVVSAIEYLFARKSIMAKYYFEGKEERSDMIGTNGAFIWCMLTIHLVFPILGFLVFIFWRIYRDLWQKERAEEYTKYSNLSEQEKYFIKIFHQIGALPDYLPDNIDKGKIIKIAAWEQKKQKAYKKHRYPMRDKYKKILVASIIVIFCLSIGIGYIYYDGGTWEMISMPIISVIICLLIIYVCSIKREDE